MLIHYLQLAILAATAASTFSQVTPESTDVNDAARQLLGDFTWDIQPEDGYPIIGFDSVTDETEVIFKYNYTGLLNSRKFLDVNLYQNDCVSASDASLTFINSTSGYELDVEIDVIEETISKSVHYQDINATAGIVGFCLRVDYNYVDNDGIIESINFYETNVTINVDLTAGFALTGINIFRIIVGNETTAEADLDYTVEAYICLNDNSEVEDPVLLTQGSTLQVCVRMDETVATENVLVEDILTFVISQPDGTATDTKSITDTVSDPLTSKVCRESGICNVQTLLQSKYFTDINTSSLRVDGVAILAFGKASLMPSSAPTVEENNGVRRLRAPIRGLLSASDVKAIMVDQEKQRNYSSNNNNKEISIVSADADSSQRMLQDAPAQSAFGLDVGLQGIRDDVSGQGTLEGMGGENTLHSNSSQVDDDDEGTDDGGGSDIVIIVVVVTILAAGCYLFFCLCVRRRRRENKEEIKFTHIRSGLGYNGSASREKTNTKTITTTETSQRPGLPSSKTVTTIETSRRSLW
jgi:hypothetical protein